MSGSLKNACHCRAVLKYDKKEVENHPLHTLGRAPVISVLTSHTWKFHNLHSKFCYFLGANFDLVIALLRAAALVPPLGRELSDLSGGQIVALCAELNNDESLQKALLYNHSNFGTQSKGLLKSIWRWFPICYLFVWQKRSDEPACPIEINLWKQCFFAWEF